MTFAINKQSQKHDILSTTYGFTSTVKLNHLQLTQIKQFLLENTVAAAGVSSIDDDDEDDDDDDDDNDDEIMMILMMIKHSQLSGKKQRQHKSR